MCYSPAVWIDAWLLLPALVAVVLTISSCLRREGTSAARLAAIKSASCVELGPAAVADALSVGALSTINVYRGDIGAEALAHLKKNLKSLLEHNPWLAGTLAPSVHTGAPIALYVPHLGDVHVQDVLAEAVEPKLTPELPYAELCKIGAKYAIDRGVPAAPTGRTRGQVFGVAALHGAEGECAALCVSLSHTVADVHTFYKVYRMLAGAEPVTRFDAVRHPHDSPRAAARMAWAHNGPLYALRLLSRLRPGVAVGPLGLDAKATRALKAAHAPTGEVPFISSSDIHTSELCRALKPDAALIEVNPRGRPHHVGHSDEGAGNCNEWLVLLRDEYDSPRKIRYLLHSAAPPARADLPSPPRSLCWSLALVSSWRFGATELPLVGCEQLVHLPNLRGWPPLRRWVCLFTPREGETATLVHAPDEETARRVLKLPVVDSVLAWN